MLRVLLGVLPGQAGHGRQLLLLAVAIDADARAGLAVGRVGLGVTRRRGQDVLAAEGVGAHFGHGVVVNRPVEQGVGRADDQPGRTAAVGQRAGGHVRPVYEAREEARVGGGEGTGDGLVGVADAHPVAGRAGQLLQQCLLQRHAVLGLVFQHVGPAPAQRLGQIGFVLQPVGRRPDEVVVVQPALPGQRRLIAAVDAGQHVHERRAGHVGHVLALSPFLSRRARGFSAGPDRRKNLFRPIALIFRLANEGGGRRGGDVAPAGDHLGAVFAAVVRQECFPQAGVVVDPAIDRSIEELAALAFVEHCQLFAQDVAADTDDFQGQAMERAHIEPNVG